MVSSQKAAEETLPWMKRTGTPSAGPVWSTWILIRPASTIFDSTPGRVGMGMGFLLWLLVLCW